jgi:acetyltransferase-like isoleucine patch superfamily enzyme
LTRPTTTGWGIDEPAPIIEDRAVVGRESVVVGGVTIGSDSYVAAGAIVTKSLPPDHIALRANEFLPLSEWRGKKLEWRQHE